MAADPADQRLGVVGDGSDEDQEELQGHLRATNAALARLEARIVQLHDRGEISNDTMWRIGRDLDLEDSGCQI
jgi:hypothetical protein